ncbi:hypothetical protein FH972_006218 [Carpinus fangiana]|uniref:KANL2-like probable zinc-finger domain-containing protein n=1 Tax=Carpinus fangiana TaxID=176857 RepID=A0A5N6QRL5_9ROSI|nr:hypothetical protein FH972_006218 [Carpinus fangiana]
MDESKPSHSSPSPPLSPMRIADSELDAPLATAEFLTRQELLKRRSRRTRQLARCYRAHYWALMEELKAKHKEYYWMYGKSPYKEEEDVEDEDEDGDCKKSRRREGSGGNEEEEATETMEIRRCEVTGCKAKAMALTKYCHAHILSDSKQKLYKGCSYCIKSTQTGPILCCKPVLRSTVPLLCSTHMQVAEKHLIRALKRGGLSISSTKKLAPKFHILVAECVRQIQTKRRAALKATIAQVQIEEELR